FRAADQWERSRSHTIKKRIDLFGQSIGLLDLDGFSTNVHPASTCGRFVKNLRPTLIIVDGKVGVRVKESDLTFALYRDATSSYISDTTVRERDSCVGYIGLVRQHCHPYGFYPIHRRADEAGPSIDIVYHEIQDHIHLPPSFDAARPHNTLH